MATETAKTEEKVEEEKVPLLVRDEESGEVKVEEFDPKDVPVTEKTFGGTTLAEINLVNVGSSIRDDAMAAAKSAESESKSEEPAAKTTTTPTKTATASK